MVISLKVTVLMGSPRKKDSYNICRLIEDNLSENSEIEFEYLFLRDFNIEDCKGCDQCFQKSETACPCNDDIYIIKKKLLNSDGIIFASPVYAYHVTAPMKRIIDRLSYLFHRQELVAKPALIVVTTGGSGHKQTAKYLKMTACGWGCNLLGELKIISPMFFEDKNLKSAWGYSEDYYKSSFNNLKKMSGNFAKAIMTKKPPTPSFYDIFMFQCLRSKTFTSKADHDFWEVKGWMNSHYFYDVKLNPIKLAFGSLLRAYINSMAKRMFKEEKQLYQ